MALASRVRAVFAGKGARGASTLAISAMLAQGITFAATPIISRLYPPETFGYLTLIISVTSIVTPIVSLRLESAILLPRRADSASALLFVGACCAVVVSLLSVLTLEVLFGLGFLSALADFPGFSWWVGGISLLSGMFLLLGQYALREHRYAAVGARNVTQAAVTVGAQLGLSIASVSPLSLVGGHALGRVAGVLPLLVSIRRDITKFSLTEARSMLSRYKQFPLLFAPAALLNSSALALPIVCAGVWFDVADAGQWGMAERVLALPLVVVAAAMGQVVEARLAQNFRDRTGGSATYYLRVSALLLGFSVVAGGLVLLTAPLLVELLLGQAWREAGVIMQLLVPMLVARLVASPMSKALVVAQWARANFWLDLVRMMLVAAVLLGCWAWDATMNQVVMWTAIAFAMIYVATWVTGLAAVRSLDG